jgi:hypothetical protein
MLATLARHWQIEVDVPVEPPMMSAITLRPDVPMPAVVHRR